MDNSINSNGDKYKKILDGLFQILNEINHIIIINTNEIFLDDVLKKLKNDKIIKDSIKLLKLVDFDLSKIAYSNKFFDIINDHQNKEAENNREKKDYDANEFSLLARRLDKVLNEIFFISNNYSDKANSLIDEEQNSKKKEHKKIKIPKKDKEKKIKMKIKKSYEVDVLSRYMVEVFNKNNVQNVIEMGCGKSYLTNNILIKEDMLYIGIDKQDHLIEKSDLKTKKNIVLINEIVDNENFNEIYKSHIEGHLFKNKNPNDPRVDETNGRPFSENVCNSFLENLPNETEVYNHDIIDTSGNNLMSTNSNKPNIMLFGLHSCGNLTSDSIKIFVKNDVLTHLVIVGCCLNLLVEYISPEVKNSKFFNEYLSSIGYDNKGKFLETTIAYEYDFRKIGYPISNYIKDCHKDLFLGRPIRNIAMQNIPKECDNFIDSKKNIKYKSLLYRTLLQKFFEDYIPELKYIYGYGKLQLSLDHSFSLYIKNCLEKIIKMIDDNDLTIEGLDRELLRNKIFELKNRIKKIPEEENFNLLKNSENVKNICITGYIDFIDLEDYYNHFLQYENILWAFNVVRIKFAKIIEYIIALDRIIFLKENNVYNVELVKIFDDKKSARNLLIYASKS